MTWVAPRTYVAAAVLTAAQLNETRDSLKAIGDAWTSYTPTWTSTGTAPALGNGTITGSYVLAGKLVHFRVKLLMGSTTTYGTGSYLLSPPANAAGAAYDATGSVIIHDASAGGRYLGITWLSDNAHFRLLHQAAAGLSQDVTNTSPMTFATSDEIHVAGTYEAS